MRNSGAVRRQLAGLRRRLRERGSQSVGRAMRLGGASVAAYGAGLAATDDPRPVTAALTALLIVQVTLVGTISDTVRRILSVVTGVGVAIALSVFVGFYWWSLGIVIVLAILVGQLIRLGPHLLEAPISAMLILAAGGAGTQATDRVYETVLGAGIGLLVNVIVPPSPRTRTAGGIVEQFAEEVADVLQRAAARLAERPATREDADGWLGELRMLAQRSISVERALTDVRESRRLNPRAVGTADPVPDLRGGLDALEHSAVALRAVFRSIAEGASGVLSPTHPETAGEGTDESPDEAEEELARRQAMATLLDDLARAFAAFGAMLRAESEGSSAPGEGRSDEVIEALDAVREARARIVDLLLVDPRSETGLWQLRGSLLSGVERVLAELDLDELGRRRERHRREALAMSRPSAVQAAHAAQRLRSSTRRMIEENPRLRHPRRRSRDS